MQQDLAEAADWYATDMATKNYYGDENYCDSNFGIQSAHCDSTGGMPGDRMSAFGYGAAIAAENSAGGFATAQSVFDAWKASPGHDQNMLRSFWVVIGIGRACVPGSRYGCYWVTDFGNMNYPPGENHPYGSPGPTPSPTPTASPTPTLSPAPTPTPSPSPSPTPKPSLWQDLTCDDAITSADALALLLDIEGASLPSAAGGCPVPGDTLWVAGFTRTWGDVDCSGKVDVLDTVMLLRWMSGIAAAVGPGNCPNPGVPY